MAKGRRPAGALETEVLAALWAATEPMTPAQVQESLRAELAYTTVMTILTRLYEKGAVSRERVGRAYAYAAVLDQSGIAAAQMRALLDRGDDRTAVLARFVDGLSGDDERALVELVRRAGRQHPAGNGRPGAGESSG
ncbi:MAG TPA: BlaI/MecI/CopY family transcriptional regulator [Mycobacteriales bacterium]|jgi:predicted transcriptional regulator|nr:BlaI/MecI/CopY family transcriptional regulator [Mycobacteriales bacterium]